MLFDELNHIAIIVTNINISLKFYTEILEFKIIKHINRTERLSEIYYLDAGHYVIELFSFPQTPPRPSRPEAAGLRHIAFGTKNFDKTLEILKSKGVDVEDVRTDMRTGKRHTFFCDPDNLPLEICET